jgi:hypothetical protein
MKKYLFSLLLSGLVATLTFGQRAARTSTPVAVSNTKAEAKAAFKWSESEHNFGVIPQGKPVTTTFSFTNTGKVPLIISQVQGSCGCTATDYSKEPIAPGKKGYVTATYNAANMGAFHKTVTVTANTDAPVVLVIKGEVKTETPSEEKTK